jgi:hypothetical protein
MLRLKLPRLPRVTVPPPPELARLAGPPLGAAVALLGRREFLKAAAIVVAVCTAPLTGGVGRALAARRGRFLTRAERETLGALCDRILPPDQDPGALALGAVDYIDRLLGAYDEKVPAIFAGGPFSGRNPFPDTRRGRPSRRRPKNVFKRFVAPTRVQDIRWRAELYGSADATNAPGAAFNDTVLPPLPGLRQIYREGLQKVDQVATAMEGQRFAALDAATQDALLPVFDGGVVFPPLPRRNQTFVDLVIQHTLEGCLSAPEYGGNRKLGGWKMVGLEGDNQPLGYSLFSTRADGYTERADHPMSTANPDELGPDGALAPRPLSADGLAIQSSIATLAGLVPDPDPDAPCT